jgi:putative membrane protein
MSHQRPGDSTLRTILIVVAIVLLFPMLMMVFAFPLMGMMGWWGGGYGPTGGSYGPMGGGYGPMMDGHYGPMMDGGSATAVSPLWGIGMMLVFLLVLLGVGYFLYRALVQQGRVAPTDPALEELRHAYARGELTDEEYETRLEKLRPDGETPSE